MKTCEDLYLRDPPKDASPGTLSFAQFYETEIHRINIIIDNESSFERWRRAIELKKIAQRLIKFPKERRFEQWKQEQR